MEDKLLGQLMDSLRGVEISQSHALELAAFLLAWAKTSALEVLPEYATLSASLLADGSKTREALRWFGSESNEDMRFPDSLGPSLDIVLRAKESGIVTRLEVADALASIAADFSMFGSIPPELVTLLIQLANISGGESVYTPWDRTAQLASRAIQLSPSVVLETPRSTNLPVWLSILSKRPFEVKFSDPITRPSATEGGKLRKFDVSVAFPPMGFKVAVDAVAQDWFTRFPEQTASGTVLAIRHALSQCNRRAVIAVPSNTLFSDGVEQALRKDLVQSGIVESVINMPSGLLNSTRLPFAILVLDPRGGHSQVRFIDADHPDFTEPEPKGRRVRLAGLESILTLLTSYVESDHAATVDIAEILNSDGLLMVNRYVLPPDKKRVFDLIRRREFIQLGKVVSTIRPMATLAQKLGGVEVHEVGAADIPPFGYIRIPGRTVNVAAATVEQNADQFLRPYDIVLIIKGSVGKVGIIPKDVPEPGPGGWVAGQSATVLRAKKDLLDARAIAVQLRSEIGQNVLKLATTGATIQLIPLKMLLQMPVFLSDAQTVAASIQVLEEETRLQAEIDRLRLAQSELSKGLWTM